MLVCVQMSIVKGEDCTLLDNSRRTRWRVCNSKGVEGLVPAICFFIPPPNKDAEEVAKKYVTNDSVTRLRSADKIEKKLIIIIV